jgi:arylsulfatase A-like enzyme/Flp pilus assembly protein TadD
VVVRPAVLSLALILWLVLGCQRKEPQPQGPPPRPNVVIVTIDTLRADRVGCYGFQAARTPHIDGLAREGVRIEHAIASVPITLPSHASIFTGLHPPAHGVRDNGIHRLPDEVETLAERLKQEGYRTQAFVSAMVLHHRYNLSQGFDGYDDALHGEDDPGMFRIQERSGERTMDRVLQWLDLNVAPSKGRQPFFLWVHLFDPHQPYAPPEADAKASPTLYDGEIASVDRQIGRLVDRLEATQVLDDTILVFTSDHGESLGEHGEATHAIFIYESTVRVPLIVRYPPKLPAGKIYAGTASGVDVMPTVLGLAGLAPSNVQGADLSKALAGLDRPPAIVAYSESLDPQIEFAMAPLHGVREGDWTYIRAPRAELYDRGKDPGETHNLLEQATDAALQSAKTKAAELDERLAKVLEDSKRFGFVAGSNPLDQQTVEMLRALGYMDVSYAPRGVEGMDPKDGIRAFNQMDQGRQLALEGNYQGAKKVLTSLLEWVPRNASARNLLAMCELRTGNPAAAMELYRQSLAYEPRQPEVLTQLGRLALGDGKESQARERLLKALEVEPTYTEAMILLAYLEVRGGRIEEAKRWYDKAIAANPDDSSAYLQYGDLYFRQNDFEQARRWYERALEAEPDSFVGSLQAGTSALRLGDFDEAERYFQRASQIDAASWKPLYNLACVRVRKGDASSAVDYLNRAVTRGFSDSTVLQRDSCFAALGTDPRFQQLIGP